MGIFSLPSLPPVFTRPRDTSALHSDTPPDQPASPSAAPAPLPGQNNTQSNTADLTFPPPRPSLYQQNLIKAEALQGQIEQMLRELDLQLRAIDPHLRLIMPSSGMRPATTLTWHHTLARWNYQIQGMGAAVSATLGWGTVAASLPILAGMAGSGPLLATAAVLGAGYLAANTLRHVLDEQRQYAVNLAIQASMREIRLYEIKLARLTQEENLRKSAMDRAITVIAERGQRLIELETKLQALNAIILETRHNATFTSTDQIHVGDGQQRRQTMSMLANAQQAIQTWCSVINANLSVARYHITQPLKRIGNTIGHRLSYIGRTIHSVMAAPRAFMERYIARQAELTAQHGEQRLLIRALSTPTTASPSIVGDSFRDLQKPDPTTGHIALSQAEIRKQLRMGEHIAHALSRSKDATPGAVVFQSNGTPMVVTANLTTTRALAWYLDAAADVPSAATHHPSAPVVRRTSDDSLLILDRDSRFYDFLTQAPTAHTVGMVTRANRKNPPEPGVFQLHDYRASFPRGTHGMQFERTIDEETGVFAIRMRWLDSPTTSGIRPAIIPLHDDAHLANRVANACLRPENDPPLERDDYRNMSNAELHCAREAIMAELARHLRLSEGEHQQLERLENWENPIFRQFAD